MKRTAAILVCTASIGLVTTISVGTTIALDPDCHLAYNKFWKKIHTPHKLDHKPSKATLRKWKQYNDEMLRKLDFTCELMIDHKLDEDLLGGNGLLGGGIISDVALLPDNESLVQLATEAIGPTAMIPEKEYPVYDSPSISLESNSPPYPVGYAGGWGGWLGGGGFNSNYPQTPPSGGSPSTPIAPTPEPLPFSLVMIGAAFIVVRRRK